MDDVIANLYAESRRLELHGSQWGGGVAKECYEEAATLRACAEELYDEGVMMRSLRHVGNWWSRVCSSFKQKAA